MSCDFLRNVLNCLCEQPTPKLVWKIGPVIQREPPKFSEVKKMAFILSDLQQVKLSFRAVDAIGNPAKVDGVPTWDSSDRTIMDLLADEDGMGAVAFAVGNLGTAQVSVQADARMGPETKTIVGTLDFEVVASEAVSITLNPGEPEDKTVTPPPPPEA